MELDSKCEGGGKHRHKVRIDVVAYNRKRRMMPDDRRSDKGLPTRSERVSPGPLSRKPFGFLFSSLGRDGHEATFLNKRLFLAPDECRFGEPGAKPRSIVDSLANEQRSITNDAPVAPSGGPTAENPRLSPDRIYVALALLPVLYRLPWCFAVFVITIMINAAFVPAPAASFAQPRPNRLISCYMSEAPWA